MGRTVIGNCARTSFLVSNLVFHDSDWARNTTKVFLETSKIFGKLPSKHFAMSAGQSLGQS